ncbi:MULTISPECIES: phosphopantetheine-binding protein [Streptomyces]|uniref:phosphopantetheine-binding protein n=1 Tax=Streptomyces TaxID=1883 RepID=UPI000399986D|nr:MULTISPECIES: phosphopantetheine-binding protein [Streptomyces]MBZ6082446.1 acyl carrier protein [Streptomyces olivaceus]MBZ6103610.1 acyl carrier protein [Streptomyces olivaceus]MBZ6110114.1 acyl carrier protein [Streptomyces olivaceus]MBZ6124711.1 acyl carrier protein [Streptomyces olivaceus]MBZ6144819.1 acyl carrier protein [Streptomyces olivaceus]
MSDDIRKPIREFISAKFPQISLADDEDIFALGFVNSLFAMELVMFVEKTFGVRVPNEQLRLDSFRTLDAMADLVGGLTDSARLSAG